MCWDEGGREEEAVVEKTPFEQAVDQEIEQVPDEQDSETGRGGGVQSEEGEDVGGDEDGQHSGEGDEGCCVEVVHDGPCRWSRHSANRALSFKLRLDGPSRLQFGSLIARQT